MQLTPDERAELRDAAELLIGRTAPSEAVRALFEDVAGFDRSLWARMAELGWPGITVPEPFGGGGALGDVAVVLTVLGRHLTPSPLTSTVVAAAALSGASNPALAPAVLPGIADGSLVATVACADELGSYDRRSISVRARFSGDRVGLSGTAGFVPDAQAADLIVVAARDERGEVVLALVRRSDPRIQVTPVRVADLTRRVARVDFDDVVVAESSLLCEPGPAAASALDRTIALGAVTVACDAVGAAEAVTERTVDYAATRVQFGRPIGSFQAVKHHCANMAIRVSAARAAVDAALVAFDDASGEELLAAAITTSYAGPACAEVCGTAVQVHGGLGFTWEHDAHVYLRRALLDEFLYGSPKWYRRRIADSLFRGHRARAPEG
jgi:alkylation response protein AidB-like acyl-CoA dehydrogenase